MYHCDLTDADITTALWRLHCRHQSPQLQRWQWYSVYAYPHVDMGIYNRIELLTPSQ